jgi:hypothetical protein
MPEPVERPPVAVLHRVGATGGHRVVFPFGYRTDCGCYRVFIARQPPPQLGAGLPGAGEPRVSCVPWPLGIFGPASVLFRLQRSPARGVPLAGLCAADAVRARCPARVAARVAACGGRPRPAHAGFGAFVA